MNIRSLFDPSRQVDRRIEKVIQYDTMDSDLLKKEIGEYVVTENMSRSFEKLLDALDLGMGEGSNEIGVERAERIQDSLSEILKGDASDAASRLGPETCALYEDMLWARQVHKALSSFRGPL